MSFLSLLFSRSKDKCGFLSASYLHTVFVKVHQEKFLGFFLFSIIVFSVKRQMSSLIGLLFTPCIAEVDQEEILASSSGLLNYLFGKKRDKAITRADFAKLQKG